MQLSKNQKIFLDFFLHFRNLQNIVNTLKQIWAWEVIFFSHYWLQKVELLKCLKIPVSEHFWVVKMLKAPKQCLNPHGGCLAIYFDVFNTKSTRKILS